MAITLNIATGQVDNGDTKKLSVTPKDASGSAITPQTLTAVFTAPGGNVTTKNKDDFTSASGVYSLYFTFNVAGVWTVKITATDSAGNAEVEVGKVIVVNN